MAREARPPNGYPALGERRWELDLTGSHPGALVQVRRWAATELADLSEDHLACLMLVAVELVTNAYEHGGGPRSVRITRTRVPYSIRIEVDDSNTDQLTLGHSRFGEGANRGRGLILVDKLGERWGVDRHAATGTKTVWAEIAGE